MRSYLFLGVRLMAQRQYNKQEKKPAYLLVLLAWLIPGAGHWYLGLCARGVVICVTICVTFFLGMVLGSMEIIDPQYAKGWFLAQVLGGLPALMGAALQDKAEPITAIYGRGVDLGQVYTGVAGLLNMLCIIDVLGRISPAIDSSDAD